MDTNVVKVRKKMRHLIAELMWTNKLNVQATTNVIIESHKDIICLKNT